MSGGGTGRSAVLIFRKELLPWSETFIASQGRALKRYRPVFVGTRSGPAGDAYLAGEDRVLLRDHALVPRLSDVALKALHLVTPAWRRALAAREPVLVHAHFGHNGRVALPIARTLGVPIVVTYHGTDITSRPRNALDRHLRARVFRNADRIIAVSEFIADQLRAAGCPAEKIVTHYIGVDTTAFQPAEQDAHEPHRVLFVGRLVTKKGLIHLLRAMPRVQRELPDAELFVAGDGPLRQSLEAEAARLGVRARFLGVQSPLQVRDLMRGAAVLCSPSIVAPTGNTEALGIVNLEAQACGLPVVAFAAGGLAESIVHGETGLVAPVGDEDALAAHLIALLGDPERRARFSAAARAHVVQRFDLHRQTALLEEIYDDVIGR